jgi:hypothetical protein
MKYSQQVRAIPFIPLLRFYLIFKFKIYQYLIIVLIVKLIEQRVCQMRVCAHSLTIVYSFITAFITYYIHYYKDIVVLRESPTVLHSFIALIVKFK